MVSAKKTKEAEKAVMLRASVEKTLAKKEDCTAGAGGFLLLLGVGFTSECHFLYCVFDFHYFVFHSSKISISQIMRILNRKIHHICDIYAFFICRQRPHSVLDSLIQEVVFSSIIAFQWFPDHIHFQWKPLPSWPGSPELPDYEIQRQRRKWLWALLSGVW